MLLDILSNRVKLNHGEFIKYNLHPSKINMAHVYFSKINQFKMVQRWSWCSWTSSATSASSTKYCKYQLWLSKFDMAHDYILPIFQRQIDLKRSQFDTGWSRGSLTPSATLSSSTMGVQQVAHDYILPIFQRQIDLKRSQFDTGWSRGSLTPSATLSSSTMGVQQVPLMSIKTWYGAC